MVITLLGVLESGGTPDPAIRQDVRQPIALTAGQTVEVRIRAVRRDGTPIMSLGIGEVIKLVARESTIRPSRKLFEVAITADTERGAGNYKGTITAAMTRTMGGMRGVFEVWYDTTNGSGKVQTVDTLIPVSELVINGSAADAPAVP